MKLQKYLAVLSFVFPALCGAFPDVQIQNWQYKSVEYLNAKKIIKGYPDGTFKPEKNVNRVEALKLILAATEKNLQTENTQNPFPDVPSESWFFPYVSYASAQNIVKGDAQTGLFSPAREVNKAEFLKMLLLAFDIDPLKFSTSEIEINDVSESDWFAPYLKFAVKFEIIKKDDQGNGNPGKILNRGETAQIIFNILKNGKGLDPQTLLNIIESRLIVSVNHLEKADLFGSSTNASVANDFSEILISFLPENNVVQAADKIAKALKSLIGAYVAGQNGLSEDVITASKQAWQWADESLQLNPSQEGITTEIKKFAESMANKARAEQKSQEKNSQDLSTLKAE